jgi:hypothetical protein
MQPSNGNQKFFYKKVKKKLREDNKPDDQVIEIIE